MVGLEQPLELQERLVVERDGLQVRVLQSGFGEYVSSRVDREVGIVPLAREPFFLGRSNDLPVDEERRGAVVVIRRYAENRRFHHARSATQGR